MRNALSSDRLAFLHSITFAIQAIEKINQNNSTVSFWYTYV